MKRTLFPLLLAIFVLLCSCAPNTVPEQSPESPAPSIETPASDTPAAETQFPTDTPPVQTDGSSFPAPDPDGSELQVVFFDVGQADCILVKYGEHAMLIDAGDSGQDSLILGYLSAYGVTSLDFLVATHPHADHIGSMAEVIRAMDSVGTLLMPDVIHTTQTFERLLDAIEEKDVPVTIPEPGETFEMGSVRIQALAPNGSNYGNLNDYSIVLRLEYGQTAFLFTGDAEESSENEQLAKDYVFSADILKVGHHGSHSSSTQRYLDAVSPSYAVISCGEGNTYGHPHSETLEKLSAMGVTLYRTDENGTIVFTTDGSALTVSAEREANPETAKQDNTTDQTASYIGNVNSKIFHLLTCGTLPAEKNRVYFTTKDDAVNSGYRACKNCKP